MTDQPEWIGYLFAGFEGVMPDGTVVGCGAYTGQDTPPEMLEEVSRTVIRGLELNHPGVRDVKQVREWTEQIVYADDEDEEETEEA